MAMKLPQKINTLYLVHRASERGQALIILLLIMVVGLTVGLSIATRTITDLRISTQTEESQKAFSAAEAGIEDALRRDLTVYTTQTDIATGQSVGQATYSTTVTPVGGDTDQFVTKQPVVQDDVTQVNLDGIPTPSSIKVYWADDNDPESSLEVTLVYLDGTEYKIQKWAYNAGTGCSTHSNGFVCAAAGGSFAGRNFKGKSDLIPLGPLPSYPNPKILRLRPFYGQASIAVQTTGGNLPRQSWEISSTGTTGQVTRKIEVTRSLNALPPIFDYVLYSGTGDITHQ
ncbi:hypothetical protein A2Z23_03170 [Candidatus Curtissbacteria bacterium RBG_16_39_7]|uniref:Type 4 fimbrial biogenesis protein PilX N-terminal domain-containing protein n=1 Tax=Candidatus Curtissbacteria bacterium RBG_16_39_7 TaxID=1797707 RepID=A0A1F5G2W7_9BACT|nr:MAG: hypothetical protein A2Z23_03170 [Candidatus Curtissbacteria bacterium RBG_16_39_7]